MRSDGPHSQVCSMNNLQESYSGPNLIFEFRIFQRLTGSTVLVLQPKEKTTLIFNVSARINVLFDGK